MFPAQAATPAPLFPGHPGNGPGTIDALVIHGKQIGQLRSLPALDRQYRRRTVRSERLISEQEGSTMAYRLAVFAMHVVEVTFFAGLLGCAVVVILSWFSVGKGCLPGDD
jgi:hypothetical protein